MSILEKWVKIEQISEDDLKYCLRLFVDTRDMGCFVSNIITDDEWTENKNITKDNIISKEDVIPLIKNLKNWRKTPVFNLKEGSSGFWSLKYLRFYRYDDNSFSLHDRNNTPLNVGLLTEDNIEE